MRPFGQTGGMKLITGLLFVALGLYCAFGFLHSFEPTEDAMIWRVGYAAAVLLCTARTQLPPRPEQLMLPPGQLHPAMQRGLVWPESSARGQQHESWRDIANTVWAHALAPNV